ncbi:disaggregatase related repeat-containing protein [Aliiglaciecola sp. CAU 1673]|uniref:disaggregatase related repeat-containing protein n=1 Tax=Aliiglaciecola sp. CAU 1673 TaxID=3032595 RepID=UPI0023DCD7B0|nr:disaggregatase related repeat-containing protein [Aliiglaciecola sp. CAU 1673]MDF2177298.1 disaggregatase related repeat-containing protein [Aliiglaciecola sp. CAU 1673]
MHLRIIATLATVFPLYAVQAQDALWAEGACNGSSLNDGATSTFFNSGAELQWQNNGGDWLDSLGIAQGNTPYTTIDVPDIDREQQLRVDVTQLVHQWLRGELKNKGFLLRKMVGGSFRIFSKEHSNASLAPVLELQTTQGNYTIPVQADTYLASSTYKCLGDRDTLNTSESVLLYFPIHQKAQVEEVLDARLVMNINNKQYGSSVVGVFAANPTYVEYQPNERGYGFSADYPNDYDIHTDSRVLLSSNFEQGNWGNQWSSGTDRETLSRVSENPEEKFVPLLGKALQAQLPQGELTAMNLYYMFKEELGYEPEEVYLRYHIRFGDKWQTVDGGKLPGIAGIYDGGSLEGGWGGRTSNGNNGWSARGIFREVVQGNNPLQGRVPVGTYLYHADMEGPYGDVLAWDGKGIGALQKNRWYAIEQHIKLNTPGENDGVFRAWIDGVPAYELTNLKFRNQGKDDIKIDRIWMNIYHGGTTPNDRTVHAFIDNVVVATEYIGPSYLDPNAPIGGTEPNRAPQINQTQPQDSLVNAVLGAEVVFEAEITDPDGDDLQINWFLDDRLVATGTSYFSYTPGLMDIGEHSVSLEVTDPEGLFAEHVWEVEMDEQNIVRLDILEDTHISGSTYKALGTDDTLSSSGMVYLRFSQPTQIPVGDITAARLVLFDERQHGDADLHVYASDQQWREGAGISDGATRQYADASVKLSWARYLGDWRDAQGIAHGTIPYSSTFVEDTDTPRFIQLDVGELIKNQWDMGSINIALTAQGGNHKFTSRNSQLQAQHPQLYVTLNGLTPPELLPLTPTGPGTPDNPAPGNPSPPEEQLPSHTSLEALSAMLEPGQWGVLQTENLSDSLLKVQYEGKSLHIAGWTDDAKWDPRTKQLFFMGFRKKPKFVAYSEQNNTWRVIDEDREWAHQGNYGHLYGNNAFDSATGRFFYHVSSAKAVYVYSLEDNTWTTTPETPFPASGTTSIEYFPELGGIVRLSRIGLELFVEQTQTWQQLGKIEKMGYHSLVRYNPLRAEVLVAGGTYEPKKLYRIAANSDITELPELPEEVTIRADKLLVHPVTGNYLLFTQNGLYDLDVDNGIYTPIEDMSYPFGSYELPFTASIDNYGVVMFVDSKVWIYKPHIVTLD